MITIIRNVHVYAPEDLGVQDVLIVGQQIHGVGGDLEPWARLPETTEIDGQGRILTPGFVDSHVHILGGGGAAGFGSRGPETSFSETVFAGTTTVWGVVGVDQEGRTSGPSTPRPRAWSSGASPPRCSPAALTPR